MHPILILSIIILAFWSLITSFRAIYLILTKEFKEDKTSWILIVMIGIIGPILWITKEKKIDSSKTKKSKKNFLLVSLIINIGLLGFFKYFNFFITSFQESIESLGFTFDTWTLNIILPVGISFYTFQTLSYSIDIYKGKIKPTNDFISFAIFVSFFPQLVAGPIERASHLLPQFLKKR